MSFSHSRKWECQEVKDKATFRRNVEARKRVVKKYLLLDFVPHNHREEKIHQSEIRRAWEAYQIKKQQEERDIMEHGRTIPCKAFQTKRSSLNPDETNHRRDIRNFEINPVPNIATKFLGEDHYPSSSEPVSLFGTMTMYERSPVLASPSIWVPLARGAPCANKRTITSRSGIWVYGSPALAGETFWPEDCIDTAVNADWPCYQEYKYEGDDRIATDLRHGRFFPIPRKPAQLGNDTVNWQQLPFIEQHEFDKVHCGSNHKLPLEEDIICTELEIDYENTEAAGKHFLGRLLDELEPKGIYSTQLDF